MTLTKTEERSSKHIALFVRSFEGSGGAERVFLNLAHGLVALGHRVDLIMAREKGLFMDQIPPEVRIVDLKVRSARQSLPVILRLGKDVFFWASMVFARKPHYVLGALQGLANYLKLEQPDALISAHDYPNVVAVVARDLARVRSRVVLTAHSTLSHEVASSKKRKVKVQAEVDRRFYPRADAVVAVSRGVAVDLSRTLDIPLENITTIYNPVVSEHLEQQASLPLEHPWLTDGGPPVLLAVGGFKPAKDFATLLNAFALVREVRPVRLILLGEGKLRESLTRQAEDLGISKDLDMPGFVDNPFQYMARASLFVFSSAFEGLGMVLVEAMACGCPVVSTDCPSGPAEILQQGRYGALAPVGDPQALAAAIDMALDAPQEKGRLIARAHDFSIERAVEKYLNLIDKL